MRAALFLLVTAMLLLAGFHPAEARRVALVIGNSAYTHVPGLTNPANDATLISRTLQDLGFSLVGGSAQLNLDKAALDRAVQDFGQQIQGAEVALFYYAGHGVQVRGSNYLVPVGANPVKEADVDFQMLDTNLVLRQMEGAGSRLNVLILDACRNNPFGGRGLRSAASGLAQMQAPEGTLISFATQPGNVALDGAGGNSPYTRALAETIRRPGIDIFRTFNEVGLAVSSATGGQQQPWVSLSPIKGDFYFSGGPGTSPPDAAAPASDELAALQSRLQELERRLEDSESSPDGSSEAAVKAVPEGPDRDHPFDGQWKVTIHDMSGCRINRDQSYTVTVSQGMIDEPRHRLPKKGTISPDGHFSIKVSNPMGRPMNTQEGTIDGTSGDGRLVGVKPSCTGSVKITKID